VGYLWILHQLYGEVIIPDAVQQELELGIQLRRHPPDFFKTYDWIRVRSVINLE
jgi:predicted nucleic acid-binding protein